MIPLPPKETQLRIVAFMDYAYSFHKEKEAEAARVLQKSQQEVENILLHP